MTLSLKEQLEQEKQLQYEINKLNSTMQKMHHEGYRFVVLDGKKRISWIKI